MKFDEHPDATNLKLIAIGKVYVAFTHSNPTNHMMLFMEKIVEIIEEYDSDMFAFIGRLVASLQDENKT